MSTYGDLIEECESYLYAFGQNKDKVTSLSSSMLAGDLTFTVDDGKQVDRGYIEIDRELIAVKSSDGTTGLVTVHPWGRGQRGTTAVGHASGAKVTNAPRFPRARIAQEIVAVIRSLFPTLFAIAVDETQTVNPAVITYPLPATAESVVRVQYQSTGPSKAWMPVTRFRVDYNADTTVFPTGKTLDIYTAMMPGRTIKIVYRKAFGVFALETDTFASIGLDEDYRDIVRMLTIGRLISALDATRVETGSIESSQRSELTQPTQASAIGRQFIQQAQQRIADERRRLLTQYPSTQVRIN